jgi:endonuclease YncB( thermonuclease family)
MTVHILRLIPGVALALMMVAAITVADAPKPSWTTAAKVLRVIDGDTLEVEVRRVIRVRLLDCWAPESKIDPRIPEGRQAAEKKAGQASKANLQKLVEGKDVIVQIPSDAEVAKSITMGRWLGRVWIEGDGESLNEKQVRGGFATKAKREELK